MRCSRKCVYLLFMHNYSLLKSISAARLRMCTVQLNNVLVHTDAVREYIPFSFNCFFFFHFLTIFIKIILDFIFIFQITFNDMEIEHQT